jgi:hypothetical protein
MDQTIVRAAIHPGIGIARVGNSADGYFIGPELPYAVPAPQDGYKDRAGALKRQAARFRIFGYNRAGQVVKELTANDAAITWTIHVANKKAAWYNFEIALDIPEAVPCIRRNDNYSGAARQQLVIDPGPRSIQGKNQDGAEHRFDTGTFCEHPVYLGELHTDEAGRLLFLGGRGHSDTIFPYNTPTTFANNNGWYDDTSDGPVTAEVVIAGRPIPVEPAWVVVAPPNYAPDLISIQTMYDVLFDTYQTQWIEPFDPRKRPPSFTEHIYPMLRRFCDMQWVNYGFHVQFGWGAPNDFLRPSYFAKLTSAGQEYAEVRRQVFNMFRNPASQTLDVDGWPQLYGDDMDIPSTGPRQYLALTQTQYTILHYWAEGNFKADWNPNAPPPPQRIENVPLANQPHTLDQAALTFCLGGPFHPGCEMTWPMRHASMYYAPFRIRPRAPNQSEQDYGPLLQPNMINDENENGPLYANGPGDITRWMAVPWQTDTASCRSGYEPEYDPYLPTFWPPRVPNHVLRHVDYERVMKDTLPPDKRMLAFQTRASWFRGLKGQYLDMIREMIADFGKLGVVERREGPPNDSDFPPVMYVESTPGHDPTIKPDQNLIVGRVEKITRHSRTHRLTGNAAAMLRRPRSRRP